MIGSGSTRHSSTACSSVSATANLAAQYAHRSTRTPGIHVITWGVTVYYLAQRLRTATTGRRLNMFFIGFVTTLLFTGTVAFAGSAKLIELMFIDNRNFPDGPGAWWEDVGQNTQWIVISNAGYYFSEALADMLLVSDVFGHR